MRRLSGEPATLPVTGSSVGWTLTMIMNKTLGWSGTAPAKSEQQLVKRDSELAQQAAKKPLLLDFPGLSDKLAERNQRT